MKRNRIHLVCMECSKHWSIADSTADPECPRCGGVDYEVAAMLPRVVRHGLV